TMTVTLGIPPDVSASITVPLTRCCCFRARAGNMHSNKKHVNKFLMLFLVSWLINHLIHAYLPIFTGTNQPLLSYSFLRRIVLQNCDVLLQATNKQLAHPYIMAIKFSQYTQDIMINIL